MRCYPRFDFREIPSDAATQLDRIGESGVVREPLHSRLRQGQHPHQIASAHQLHILHSASE